MTPFGQRIRNMRNARGITQRQMAADIGVSSAYLSALEHGKRGRPSWHLLQKVIAYFNIIWDDADEIVRLARLSHPRITIDTSGLSPKATALANHLADRISEMSDEELDRMLEQLGEPLRMTNQRLGRIRG